MKIAGIIAEFNPFHNGHEYIIQKAKECTGADYVIVAMSGDFVQRGEPAIFPKHLRAKMALHAGADLVIELPVEAATGSAEYFASTGVSLLSKLGVTHLCYGCESILDQEIFCLMIKVLCEEPDSYKQLLKKKIKTGKSYPKARQEALIATLTDMQNQNSACTNIDIEALSEYLNKPNNILGIEYQKAIDKLNSKDPIMTAIPILRQGATYHEQSLPNTNLEVPLSYPSATALRKAIKDRSTDMFGTYVPEQTNQLISEFCLDKGAIFIDDFSLLLHSKLMNLSPTDLEEYLDVSADLANKIKKNADSFISILKYCELLKSADLTYSRISRALLHIILEIKTDISDISTNYGYVLGFHKNSGNLLSYIKKEKGFPLISKISEKSLKDLDAVSRKQLNKMINVSNLYEAVVTNKYHTPFIHEKAKETVRI